MRKAKGHRSPFGYLMWGGVVVGCAMLFWLLLASNAAAIGLPPTAIEVPNGASHYEGTLNKTEVAWFRINGTLGQSLEIFLNGTGPRAQGVLYRPYANGTQGYPAGGAAQFVFFSRPFFNTTTYYMAVDRLLQFDNGTINFALDIWITDVPELGNDGPLVARVWSNNDKNGWGINQTEPDFFKPAYAVFHADAGDRVTVTIAIADAPMIPGHGIPAIRNWLYSSEPPYGAYAEFPPGWQRFPGPGPPSWHSEEWASQLLNTSLCAGLPCRSTLSVTAPYTGWYSLQVMPYDGPEDLNLTLQLALEANQSLDGVDSIEDAVSTWHVPAFGGNLSWGLDCYDWYKIRLTAGQSLSLNLRISEFPRLITGELVQTYEVALFTPDRIRALAIIDSPQAGMDPGDMYLYIPSSMILADGDYVLKIAVVNSPVSSLRVCTTDGCTPFSNSTTGSYATYELQLELPNDRPVWSGTTTRLSGVEDTELSLRGDSFFGDPEGDPLEFVILSIPAGALTYAVGDVLTLTPPPDFFGNLTITLRATDWFNASTDLVVTAYFAPVPDAPRVNASAVPAVVRWDQLNDSGPIDYSRFLVDPDGELLGLSVGAGAPVIPSPCGPACVVLSGATDDIFGDFRLHIAATDPTGRSAAFSLNVSIRHVNRAPWLNANYVDSVAIVATSSGVSILAAQACFDADGDPVTLALISSSLTGGGLVATPLANGSGTDLHLSVPDEAHVGSWVGSFACSDRLGAGPPFDLVITVVPPNHPPAVGTTTPGLGADVAAGENSSISFSATFADERPTALSFAWLMDGTPMAGAQGNRAEVYLGFDSAGTHTIAIVATDDGGLSTTISWTVSVSNVDRPPVCGIAAHGSLTAPAGTNISFSSSSVDPDGDALLYLWTSNGSLLSRQADAVATVSLGTEVIGLRVTAGSASSQCSMVIESTDVPTPPAGGEGELPTGRAAVVVMAVLAILSAAGVGAALLWWRRRG